MRNLDFSSWQTLLSTLVGLAVITLVMVGIRLLVMQTMQQRRERENRQINERLRTLISAYKTLGGSFTGDLAVHPTHLRDLQRRMEEAVDVEADATDAAPHAAFAENQPATSDRSRRIRDAVEAALSDVILLGTEEQVQLAARAAAELAAGRVAHTAELVVSLRSFIREVLDLERVPTDLFIPRQGPARPAASRGGGKGEADGSSKGGKGAGGGGAAAGGMGFSAGAVGDDEPSQHR